jgi:hypothetical protein
MTATNKIAARAVSACGSGISDPKNGHAGHARIHHKILWNNAAPLILSEHHKKAAP